MRDIEAEIRSLVESKPLVLFMKGTRQAPRCGFSAQVVEILDEYLEEYCTKDVLEDPPLREAIKRFSNWPTLPQLYVKGEFIGGADIVRELEESGELLGILQKAFPHLSGKREVVVPQIEITPSAIRAFCRFAESAFPTVRLEIDENGQPTLDIDEKRPRDVVIDFDGVRLVMSRQSAKRANGLLIDFDEGAQGFRVERGQPIRFLSPGEYARLRREGWEHLLIDVRDSVEREIAQIEGSVPWEEFEKKMNHLRADLPLVCYCHRGIRSIHFVRELLELGFKEVYNLKGGIDAWSREVDPQVPRY
ncbi:MAG: Grx4 family monothiol glutaredoxin [Sandaracinaceae bacterium]|nr:Grx4 family monothiol glutaredoxin [Sandaracinaceae bacterium]